MILRLTVRLETPVAVSRRRATGNDLETLDFIPGTSVRGAMAGAYLSQGSPDDPAFTTLFLDNKVRFGDLRPGGYSRWPLSARWCRKDERHPQFDLLCLYGALASSLHQHNPAITEDQAPARSALRELDSIGVPSDHLFECQECGDKTAYPGDGFCVLNKEEDCYEDRKPNMRRVAHVQIDPELLRSRNGAFHSASVITRNQTLIGRVWACSEAVPALKALVGKQMNLWVGRGRSRGQGRMTAWLDEEEADPGQIDHRILSLNETASQLSAALANHVVFSCTLNSAAILLDEWLLSKDAPTAADIDPELKEYELLTCFTRGVDIAGWNAGPRAQLPKPEVRAVAAGSCFLFGKPHPGDRAQEYHRLAAILAKAENECLGERGEEGFGEAVYCSPFHLRFPLNHE